MTGAVVNGRVALDWSKVRPGWYEATDPDGTRWRIVQSGNYRWEVILPGVREVSEFEGETLAEAKMSVEEEVAERLDTSLRARREERRSRQRALLRQRDRLASGSER